jgi:hypothetical protein
MIRHRHRLRAHHFHRGHKDLRFHTRRRRRRRPKILLEDLKDFPRQHHFHLKKHSLP